MRRTLRYKRRRATALLDLSLTPLIDTALTLLIIFMITTPIIQNAIRVSLPKGHQEELIELLKQRVGEQQDKHVYVKADQDVSYGKVIELVDRIKVVGGVSHVILATQRLA